jgi:UDP-glucose 4-epimerase
MKKVVVFGGSGFLGSYVADELTRRDYSVTVADITPSKYLQESQKFVKVDITDMEAVKSVIEDCSIVYNFVAVADLDEAIHKPVQTMNLNVMGNLNILQACRENGNIERFVYASSAYALSDSGSFYGISKHTSEKLTDEYFKRYGQKFTIIRYGSLYGERADEHNYIYNILLDAITKKEMKYKGDGKEVREYIHSADAAKLSVDILEDRQYENEHIILTGVERLQRLELLSMIRDILGSSVKITQSEKNYMGHYKITPYTFQPTLGKKLIANPFIDMGQGLVQSIKAISEEISQKEIPSNFKEIKRG